MAALSSAALLATVERMLTDRGPMTEDELLDAFDTEQLDLGPDPDDALAEVLDEDSGLVLPLADGRWALVPALLSGRVFTHRLDSAEVEHDLLNLGPDLAPVAILIDSEEYQQLADGSPLTEVVPLLDDVLLAERGVPEEAVGSDGAFLLEPGRLAALGVGAGDLVGLRLTPAGLDLEVVAADSVETPTELGQRLEAILADDPDEPEHLDIAVWTVCADDVTLFRRPSPPLGQLLDELGLPREGDLLAGSGFDFRRWRVGARRASIKARYRLTDDEALAVLATVTMYEQVAGFFATVQEAAEVGDKPRLEELRTDLATAIAPAAVTGSDRTLVGEMLALLAEPAVAQAVLDETGTNDGEGAAALGLFAETLEPLAVRPARPALRWLRAKAYERLDDVTRAETTYREAQNLDPAWPLPLADLARYASDRGDAAGGLSLLRRAGAPSNHELVRLLEHFQTRPRTDVGRNQPCWCGSGRKYKQCHLQRERLPLAERAAWLHQKAGMVLVDGPFQDLLMAAAAERSRFAESPAAMVDAAQHSIVTDAVLFEGGAFEHFLATRGHLLPDDERSLAEQWLLIDRSVYEIQSVRRGEGLTVRDVRTGDVHDVRERTASRQLKADDLVCARLVPAGDTMQIFGGLEPVALHERDALIALLDEAPTALELVAFLTRRFAPPVLQNTEGESLVMCDAVLRVSDPDALATALDVTYDREDGKPAQWFEHVVTDGMQRIRATLELHSDELHLHANSETRFDRVLDAVRGLDRSVTVISESREPIGDLHEAMRLAERNPAPEGAFLDPSDPDIAAALQEVTLQYEQRWLDESIPALAGHTPRECAADPTRRADLIRLLDSFPQSDNPGVMNPNRLRAALGLS